MKNPENKNSKNKNSKSEKPESEKPESGKAEKRKDRAGRAGRAGSNERDGITHKRKTWQGEAVAILDDVGTDTGKQWFTHKAIERLLQMRFGIVPSNLAHILHDLVKRGYLERSYRPERLNDKYQVQHNYIYRRTGKAFRERAIKEDMRKGIKIRFENRRHDKWFREMMQY